MVPTWTDKSRVNLGVGVPITGGVGVSAMRAVEITLGVGVGVGIVVAVGIATMVGFTDAVTVAEISGPGVDVGTAAVDGYEFF